MYTDKKSISISMIRAVACLMIVAHHTIAYYCGITSWLDTGVQIFFFMSGYLYGGKAINAPLAWMRRQLKKIMIPYWVYLLMILPVILVLDPARLNLQRVAAAFVGVQGLLPSSWQIQSLGQHWFISYILICYALTPLAGKLPKKRGGVTRRWICYALLVIALQLITVPAAYAFSFKASYIAAYFFGYCYYAISNTEGEQIQKRIWDVVFIALGVAGSAARLAFADKMRLSQHAMTVHVGDLLVQYIRIFQGVAVFLLLRAIFSDKRLEKAPNLIKSGIELIAGYSYEIYLVHEFFVNGILPGFPGVPIALDILARWLMIAMAACVLHMVTAKIKQHLPG